MVPEPRNPGVGLIYDREGFATDPEVKPSVDRSGHPKFSLKRDTENPSLVSGIDKKLSIDAEEVSKGRDISSWVWRSGL